MFEQSRRKIEWANHHISYLKTYISKTLSKSLFVLSIEDNPMTARRGVVCRLRDINSAVPLIVGDVVHNLSSALDILYCDICRYEDIPITKHSKWPFRKTREELIGTFKGAKKQAHLSDGVIDLITNSIQTYRHGNGDLLYKLHDLNIEDKHKVLLPVITIKRIVDIEYLDENGAAGNCAFGVGGSMDLAKDISFRAEGDAHIVEITDRGKAIVDVFFGEGDFSNHSILPILNQLSQRVQDTVAVVEDYIKASENSCASSKK